VPRRPDRIAHVVQAVEEGDEVKVFRRVVGRCRRFEPRVGRSTVLLRMDAGLGDRVEVEVIADEIRFRESLRHDDGREAVAAAHVSDCGALL
jgi:hypothetical protein